MSVPASSIKSKLNILIVVRCLDGIGDLEHFKAYCIGIKDIFPDAHLVGFVSIYQSNTALMKNAESFYDKTSHFFQSLYIHVSQNIHQTQQDVKCSDDFISKRKEYSANEKYKTKLAPKLNIQAFEKCLKE